MSRVKLLGVFILFVLPISAQSLEECRRLANEHYPEIKRYDIISKTEQYSLANAAKAWIPQLQFFSQASYQSSVSTYPKLLGLLLNLAGENGYMQKDQYRVAIDVNQLIWDGGKNRANKSLINAESNEQSKTVDVTLYQVQQRVDNLYFGILLLDERIKQTELTSNLIERNLAKVRSLYKNGVAMQSDVDEMEVEFISIKQKLEQVKTVRFSYRQMLEIFIGQRLWDENLMRPTAQIPIIRTSLRPEIQLFEAQINKIEVQIKLLNASVMPIMSAFAQGFYGYPGLDMFKSMMSSRWRLDGIIGVRLTWNLAAFYTQHNSLKKLKLAKEQIDLQKEIFLFNTNIQTTQDDGEIERLRKTVSDDEKILKLRRSIRIAAESQLEQGVIDTSDLLNKITAEQLALQIQSEHEIELLQTIYRLKNSLNQ